MEDKFGIADWSASEGCECELCQQEYAESVPENEKIITQKLYTKSGNFVVFHSTNACQPDVFNKDEGEGWYFEPVDYESNDIFSPRYDTPEEALAAAENWEAQDN